METTLGPADPRFHHTIPNHEEELETWLCAKDAVELSGAGK
jgi:hypothetical protein